MLNQLLHGVEVKRSFQRFNLLPMVVNWLLNRVVRVAKAILLLIPHHIVRSIKNHLHLLATASTKKIKVIQVKMINDMVAKIIILITTNQWLAKTNDQALRNKDDPTHVNRF